jgi:flavin reductase (DIM6/NTAB) family NADH-FMN oxidoreductase RutF
VTHIFDDQANRIYMVGSHANDRPCGMIVTWVSLASLTPTAVRIMVALSPMNFTTASLRKNGHFSIALLGQHQASYIMNFGTCSSRIINKFKDAPFSLTELGNPVLSDSCGSAECVVLSEMDLGDRIVIAADVQKWFNGTTTKPLYQNLGFESLSPHERQILKEKYDSDVKRDLLLRSAN